MKKRLLSLLLALVLAVSLAAPALAAGEKDEDYYLFSDLLEILSYAGLGGKISSGYGRFTAVPIAPSKEFVKRLEGKDWKQFLSLSACLPNKAELDSVMQDANVRLCKRSGWVSPGAGTDPLRKRKEGRLENAQS